MSFLAPLRRAAGRIPTGLRIGVVCTLLGIAAGVGGAHLLAIGKNYRPVGRLLVSADGRTLAGTVGGCGGGALEVTETSKTITVRLRVFPNFMIAPGECAIETFTAHLRSPWGHRRIIDGVTGHSLPAFDGEAILRPAVLPSGFVHRYDTASLSDETVIGGGAGCVQIYTQADAYDDSLWIEQDVGAQWVPPDGVSQQAITVRGHPGTAIAGEIEWSESGQLFTITSKAYAYAILTTAELISIANSLS